MWTLAPSLVVTTQAGWGEVRSLATGERWDVRPEDLDIVRALAVGIPEAAASQHRELRAAAKRGWAAQAESTADAQVRSRIEALERGYAWCRAAMPEATHAAILAAHATRRRLHRGFAQHVALPETVARRAALVGVKPQDVLVLGDDDFTSIGLLQLGHRVTVIANDDAIADLIRRNAGPSAALTVLVHDLREPLPPKLVQAFDAFFTDPLSGPGAVRLAMARGLAALKPNGRGFVCVSEAAAPSSSTLAQEFGVSITDRYSDFNHYHAYDYTLDYYVSDLVVVRSSEHMVLRPAAAEPYLVRGLTLEDDFFETPATRYAFRNIRPETAQLIHIDARLELLQRIGRLSVRERSYSDNDGIRSYLIHTTDGGAVLIRLLVDARVGELFVCPANLSLEDALITVLRDVLGIETTIIQKHRVRGSSVYTLA